MVRDTILATALALGLLAPAASIADPARPVTEQARAAFRAETARDDVGALLELIRQRFPDDYQAFETQMIAHGSTRPEDQGWMKTQIQAFIREIDDRLKPARAAAPDAAVVEVGRQKLALMKAARPLSPRLCYEYVEAKHPTLEALEPVHLALRAAILRHMTAEMRAGLAGERTPTPRAPPSREDVGAMVQDFAARGGDMAWFKAVATRQPQTFSDARRCDFAVAWQEAMVAQPADRAARLLVR